MIRASPTLAVYKTRCLVAELFNLAWAASGAPRDAGSSDLDTSSAALASAGAMLWDPVADRALGTRSSQRSTATAAVHPLFLSGSSTSCASTAVKVWSRSSGIGAFGFFLMISSSIMCSFFPHQSAAKVPAWPSKTAK